MSVRPRLLGIYEKYFLVLGKELVPTLHGFVLGLLPGLEDESEHSDRYGNCNMWYVYMCVCVCMLCMCACVCVCVCAYMCVHVCVFCVYVFVHVCVCTCVGLCIWCSL